MANIDYTKLRSYLSQMLKNIVEHGLPSNNQYRASRYYAGDDTSMAIHKAGVPLVVALPDPENRKGSSFLLVDDGYDAHESFVDMLCNDEMINRQVGRKAIDLEIERLLRSFKNNGAVKDAEIAKEVKHSCARLKGLVKTWRAVVPVDNLVLVGLTELTIGRVRLLQTASVIPSVLERSALSIDVSSSSAHVKEGTKQTVWEVMSHNFGETKTCAELTVDAEVSRLPLIVDDEVDAALNILRCFMSFLFPRGSRNYIGLRGEIISTWRPCLGMTADIGAWNLNLQQIGAMYAYELTPEKIELLRKHCAFDTVCLALSKVSPPPTEFESTLLTASRWLGRGVVASDNAEKVLNLSVSLEKLVCGTQRDLIADTLAKRLAFLIGTTKETRQFVNRRVKKLYGLRSKVVHEGTTEIAEEDVVELETIACTTFIKLAERAGEFTKDADFHNWVEEQMFTLPQDSTEPTFSAQ